MDIRVLVFACLATAAAALGCAVLPVKAGARIGSALLKAPASTAAPAALRWRTLLVSVQVAVAVVLGIGATLLGRSLVALDRVDLGYDPVRLVATTAIVGPSMLSDVERRRAAVDALIERAIVRPGVQAAAGVALRPLWGEVGYDWPFTADGQPEAEAARNPLANFLTVTPGYFDTMGIPLRGRDFTEADREDTPGVVIVSEGLARHAWQGEDAIGKRLRTRLPETPFDRVWLEVIGIVPDVRHRDLTTERIDFYVAHTQSREPLRHLMLRLDARADRQAVAAGVRSALRTLDPESGTAEVTVIQDEIAGATAGARFRARVLVAFALAALALLLMGVYATVAHAASQRTRELGIRIALGARSTTLLASVVGRLTVPVVAGIAAGFLAAAAAAELVETLVYEVRPIDPWSYAAVGAVVVAAAGLAGLLPARRALRIDPADVLRQE